MRLATLRRLLGDDRLEIVDVGARGGPHERWTMFRDLAAVTGFDADPAECARLNAEALAAGRRHRYLPVALWSSEGTAVLNLCRSPGCSSLYVPNKDFVDLFPYGEHMEVVGTTEVQTTTLDRVVASEPLRPDHLKIDAQGAELDILRGAVATLPRVAVVELEVAFNELYLGQPLFGDVDAFMRARGFLLIGLRRTSWRRRRGVIGRGGSVAGGQIVHGDAVYYNDALLSNPVIGREDLVNALMALSAYRQHAFVLHLLADPRAARLVDAPDRQALADILIPRRSFTRRLVSHVIGRLDHKRLRRWVDEHRQAPALDWHDPEFF